MPKIRRSRLMLFVLSLLLYAVHTRAQTYPLGTVGTATSSSCPSGVYSDPNNPAVCYSMPLNCPNTTTATVTYSVDTPSSPKGTIVLFSGSGGTSPSDDVGQEYTFAQDYFNDGYQVVQFAWSADWENTNLPPAPPPANPIVLARLPAARLRSSITSTTTTFFRSTGQTKTQACARRVPVGARRQSVIH